MIKPMTNGDHINFRKPIRWKLLLFLLLFLVAGLVRTWFFWDVYQQAKYMRTGQILAITMAGFFVWLLFLSRIRKKTAFMFIGTCAFIGLLLAGTFRISGVNGDLLPILEFRWKRNVSVPQSASGIAANAAATSIDITTNAVNGAGFPQFMGPDRNATLAGPKLATNWAAMPPVELWRKQVGAAWSGFAIVGSYAVTQEQHGDEERTIAYDLSSGTILWTHGDQTRYATVIAGEGPRSTPTISSNKVYTYGASGILNCLELTNGKPVWSKSVWAEQGAKIPDWGVSCSPLVYGDKVVVTSGLNGSNLAAFATRDGAKLWDAPSQGADYSSPGLFTLHGKPQIFHFNGKGLSAFEPADGKQLWHYNWMGGHPHIAMPVQVGEDRVIISTGYGVGAELIKVSAQQNGPWQTERVWKSMGLKSKFAPLVVVDGYIYGLDDGIFTCLELSTGKRQWKDGRYGHGQFLLVGSVILMMAEKGSIVLIEPDPTALVEVGSYKVFEDKTWNPPALAGDLLLVRNDKEAACFRLPLQK
ncbi:MAG: PQQ-binding-like beta-propeller repeat protein [Verrucomicrobiales bacterium]